MQINQIAGNRTGHGQARQLMDVEPGCIFQFVSLGHNFTVKIAGMKAQHQRMRKRPALAGDITQILYPDLCFFHDFAPDTALYRLPGFRMSGQNTVHPGNKAWRPGQQYFITTTNQNNHAGGDARIIFKSAMRTMAAAMRGITLHWRSTATTKLVLVRPGSNLAGKTQHAASVNITL